LAPQLWLCDRAAAGIWAGFPPRPQGLQPLHRDNIQHLRVRFPFISFIAVQFTTHFAVNQFAMKIFRNGYFILFSTT
jgi:hypothetical protein